MAHMGGISALVPKTKSPEKRRKQSVQVQNETFSPNVYLEVDGLDDTDGDGLTHVTNGDKRPKGGKSEKNSTQRGLVVTKVIMAASQDLMNLRFSSVVLPVWRSHFFLI